MVILYDNYVLEAFKKTYEKKMIGLQKKNNEDSNGGKNRRSQRLSGNNLQNKSSKSTTGLIKRSATNKSISQTSKIIKVESEPRIVEIESDSEPKSPITDDSQELEPKLKQESVKNDPSANPKEQSTSDNLQNSDLKVVKHKIYDVVSCLGKNTVPVQETIRELMNLAMAIDNNQLGTSEIFTPEGSGHNKKYVVKTIYDVLSALGSGSATETETIGKLFNLATWLSSPPPKATATETKAPKDKDLDPAKASGPKPTDADKTNIKNDGVENDGATPKSGKGKGKKKPNERGAEDSEVKVAPEDPDKEAPPASGGDEKKDGKEKKDGNEGVTPANPGKEGIKPDLTGKTGASATGVAGGEGAVPIASGDADTAPKTEAPKPLPIPEVPAQQALQSSETRPEVMNQRFTQLEAQPPTNQTLRGGETDYRREVEYLNFAQSQTQSQGQPTPRIGEAGEAGNHHNFRYLNVSQPQTQISGQPTPQIRQTGNHHVFQPQTQFPGQQGQPALQIGEMGNLPEFGYRNISQTQTQFSGQPTPQIGEPGNHREFGYRNIPQAQTQFPGKPTPQIGEPGNHREFGYVNVLPQQQTQFPRQQFSQATEAYIPGQFGKFTGAQSQNLNQPQQTQQAGEFGSVDGFNRYHSTKSQDRPPFPVQQPPQGYVNGSSPVYIREIKPNLSVPLTDTSGGSTGPTSFQLQGLVDGRNPYADSARQAYSSSRKPTRTKSKLPGSYDQDDLSDSSGSSSSSESGWESTRDTDRGPSDQDGLNNRGGHDTRRSRHERSDRHKSGRVSSRRDESSWEGTRRGGPRREGSRREESSWEDTRRGRPRREESSWEDTRRERPRQEGSRREESNRENARRGGAHREGHRRDGSYSMERRAEESYHRKESHSRRDKTRTKTAHPEDLQTTTTSKKPPIGSEKQTFWTGYLPFVGS